LEKRLSILKYDANANADLSFLFYALINQKGIAIKLTLDIPNEQLFNQIVWFLKRFKNVGLEMDETY
jgi:hypothetical protein